MDITPPGDDKGVRRLKLDNEKGEVKQTRAVAPYPRIESSEERREPRPPLLPEKRKRQRRRQERRQYDMNTAFDTRGTEDRRTLKRRKADRYTELKEESDHSSGEHPPIEHIDEEV